MTSAVVDLDHARNCKRLGVTIIESPAVTVIRCLSCDCLVTVRHGTPNPQPIVDTRHTREDRA